VVTGGDSYRAIVTFIDVHRHRLNAAFGLASRLFNALERALLSPKCHSSGSK
jgi:hypothetical protein